MLLILQKGAAMSASARRKIVEQYQTIEQLTARVRELEWENVKLKAESRDASLGLNDYYGSKLAAAQAECEFQRNAHKQAEELMLEQSKQLAAEQLNNKLLREALEFLNARIVTMDLGGVVERALSIPASTEALDKHVAEKVKKAGKFDMWKTNPYTKVLETSIKQLTKQRDLAVEAMREALECGEDGDWQSARRIFASAIKESEK